MLEPRPCERQCGKCRLWKHHSRYRVTRRNGSVSYFANLCRDCEQIERNERKNADRPYAIIRSRASDHGRKAGVGVEFMWVNMNYRSLVPHLRAMMTPEGLCTSCGHSFLDESDIQIEHREPPRHRQDWARLHARNLGIACKSCNNTKGHKAYWQWLDEQEQARLSNERHLRPMLPSFTQEQLAYV